VIRFLDCAARSHHHVWPEPSQRRDSSFYLFKSVGNTPYLIVHRRRSVQGDDHVVDIGPNGFSVRFQQQPGCQQSDTDSLGAKHLRQENHLGIQLRFPASEYNPANTKFAEARQLSLKKCGCDFPGLANPPDVAHYTAAVALIVRRNDQDWHGSDPVRSNVIVG
jgi:hypothetical protein